MAMDLPKEQSQKKLAKKSSSSKSVAASLHKIEHNISKRDQKKQLSLCKGRILPEGLKVSYISKGKTLQTGYTKGRGIFCDCCKRVVSPTMFESHAGKSSSRKPYQHIYLLSGLSLHQHASSKKLNCVQNNNDLMCMVCHKSKNLLLCEGCPKSFHKECIAESSNSSESSSEFKKRFCNQCEISMKCLTPTANAMENGRVYEVGPIEDVEKHGLQIIDDTCDLIACVLCRSCEYNVDVFCDQTSIVCEQCEKEYHIGCLREVMDIDLQELPLDNWFCSADCMSLNWLIKFSTSQPLKVLDSYMEAVKKKLNDSYADNIRNLDIKWIVFNCKDACEENKLLITQAVDIFHDCFNPIIDSVTEKDFISSMAYGEQMGSLNFSGVYAALITINPKLVINSTLMWQFKSGYSWNVPHIWA